MHTYAHTRAHALGPPPTRLTPAPTCRPKPSLTVHSPHTARRARVTSAGAGSWVVRAAAGRLCLPAFAKQFPWRHILALTGTDVCGEEGPTEGARWEVSMSSTPDTNKGVFHEWRHSQVRLAPQEGGSELPGTGADLGHSVIQQTSWRNHSVLMAGAAMLPRM